MGIICENKKKSQIRDKSEKPQEKTNYIFPKDDDDDIEFKLETIFNFNIKEPIEINSVNKDMYDAIFSCESIKELFNKGWKYKLSYKFIQSFYKKPPIKFCPLCVIGETNKGKTFIVNLLTGNLLKSGIEVKTEGIFFSKIILK